jgi:hypothetical protein
MPMQKVQMLRLGFFMSCERPQSYTLGFSFIKAQLAQYVWSLCLQ